MIPISCIYPVVTAAVSQPSFCFTGPVWPASSILHKPANLVSDYKQLLATSFPQVILRWGASKCAHVRTPFPISETAGRIMLKFGMGFVSQVLRFTYVGNSHVI